MKSVDSLDLRLIRALQDNPRAPYSTIARLTGVSETTVKRRVDELIANRMIVPAMIPNIYRLGYRTRATIGLRVDLNHMMAIAEEISSFPEVAFVALATGRFDVTFFVAVPSLEALTRFMVEKIAPIEGVRETETIVTPRVLKVFADWRVPIDVFPDPEDDSSEDGLMSNGSRVASAPDDNG